MTTRFAIQESRYEFPYHWLASYGADGASWTISRELRWGLEQLGLLHAVTGTILDLAPSAVLDVGCGDGRLVHELLASGVRRVEGLDLAPRAIAFAQAFLGPDRADLVRCAAVQDGPAGPFDVVSLVEVIEHVPEADLDPLLEAVHTWLAPEGRLVVTVPTTNVPVIPKHERHYDPSLLAQHLGDRFEILELRWLHRDARITRLLRAAMTNRFVGLHWRPAVRAITRAYQRHVLDATARDGAHLLVVARPR